jgi:hypothetical protein
MSEGLGSDENESALGHRAAAALAGEPGADAHLAAGDGQGAAGAEPGEVGRDQGSPPSDRQGEPPLLDDVPRVLTAPDASTFFGGLIGALSGVAAGTKPPDRRLASILRLLGRALGDGIDEEMAFEDVVEAIDGRHSRSQEWVVASAALLARIAGGSSLRTRSPTSPVEAADLVRAAAQVVRAALDDGEAQSWRLLPHLAATIARRNAQRNLPIAALAAALPRFWAQQGTKPHDLPAAAADQLRSGVPEGPQLLVFDGPVEIVILGR